MFCTACGVRIRDGDRFCRRCGHQIRGEHQESLNPGDKSYISIMGDAEDPALDTREKLKQDKAKVLQTFNLIVDDPSIPVDDKVRAIINLTALTCAVVAIQPIPFADFFILTPIQVEEGPGSHQARNREDLRGSRKQGEKRQKELVFERACQGNSGTHEYRTGVCRVPIQT